MSRQANVRILSLFPKLSSLLLFTCLAQVSLSEDLGRDTLKTITANESYELGYGVTKSQARNTYFYSVSSGLGLIRLARQEFEIYNAAHEIFSKVKIFRNSRFEKLILEYLEDYNGTSGVLIKEEPFISDEIKVSKVAGDLIGAYRMVRRFRNYIQQGLRDALASLLPPSTSSSEAINALKPLSAEGPFRRDMHLTMFAIIFTQLQFGWSPHRVSMGTIKGLELGATLRAVHCIELGVHAVASGIYSVGIDWLELATIKIQNGDPSADLNLALDLLQKANAKHDKLWHPFLFWPLNGTFFTKRLSETNRNESRQWERSFAIDASGMVPIEGKSWDICTGHLKQTDKTKSELFCWHETKIHPSWKLGPLKAELLANFPQQLIQFHNVLGMRMDRILNMQAICDDQMETSFLLGMQKQFNPKLRLSENCFASNGQLDSLTGRIAGLVSAGWDAEAVPVASYPPGGHTRLHVDYLGKGGFKERIATLIYIVEGPEIGGELIFPMAKVAVKPLKGSAILWYNILKSSELNYGTWHASCAVVKGQKTIATHWIQYDRQAHLTCARDSRAKIEYPSDGKSHL